MHTNVHFLTAYDRDTTYVYAQKNDVLKNTAIPNGYKKMR